MTMFKNILSDLKAFCEGHFALRKIVLYLFVSTDFKAVFWYRIAYILYQKKLKFLAHYLVYRAKIKYGVEISPLAKIGPGFRLIHSLGTVIGNGSVIGKDCTIYQQVTLGTTKAQEGKIDYPVIGDKVIIYAGAKVIGAVNVGNNATIGANAVVLNHVPAGALAVGVPARIVSQKPSIEIS